MHDLLTELEGQGVQYCEVRFAPQLHTQKGMSQNEVIEAVKAGLYSVAGVKPESIHAGIILCCMRGSDNGQQNKITVEEAARHLGSGVCAVDLAGAEALYPTEQYADLFAYASSYAYRLRFMQVRQRYREYPCSSGNGCCAYRTRNSCRI